MKKSISNKWKNIPGFTVQYYLDGDYFEIRGRVHDQRNFEPIFEKIIKLLKVSGNQAGKRNRINQSNIEEQQYLFKDGYNGGLLKNIPVLKGNSSLKKIIYKKGTNNATNRLYRAN